MSVYAADEFRQELGRDGSWGRVPCIAEQIQAFPFQMLFSIYGSQEESVETCLEDRGWKGKASSYSEDVDT